MKHSGNSLFLDSIFVHLSPRLSLVPLETLVVPPQLGPVSGQHGLERRGEGGREGQRGRRGKRHRGVRLRETCARCGATPAAGSRSPRRAPGVLAGRCSFLWSEYRAAASAGEPHHEHGSARPEPSTHKSDVLKDLSKRWQPGSGPGTLWCDLHSHVTSRDVT